MKRGDWPLAGLSPLRGMIVTFRSSPSPRLWVVTLGWSAKATWMARRSAGFMGSRVKERPDPATLSAIRNASPRRTCVRRCRYCSTSSIMRPSAWSGVRVKRRFIMNCMLRRVSPRLPMRSPESSPVISINWVSGESSGGLDMIDTADTPIAVRNLSTMTLADWTSSPPSASGVARTLAGSPPIPKRPDLPGLRTSISTSSRLASSCFRTSSIASSTVLPFASTLSVIV